MVFEAPKVAVSVVAFGTVAGVQLAAVFQSLVAGFNVPRRAAGFGGTKTKTDKRQQAEAASTTEVGMGAHEGDGI